MRWIVTLLLIADALLFAYAQFERTTGREPDRLGDQLDPNAVRLIGQHEAAELGVAGARGRTEPDDHPAPGAGAASASPEAAAAGATARAAAKPDAAKPDAAKPDAARPDEAKPDAAKPDAAKPDAPAPGAGASAAPGADQGVVACLEWGPFSDNERARAEADLGALALTAAPTRRAVRVTDAWWVNVGAMTARAAAERRSSDLQSKSIDDLSVVDYGSSGFTVSLGVFRTEAAATARAHALAARGVTDLRVEPWKQPITLTMLVIRRPATSLSAQFAALEARYSGTDSKAITCPAQP